MDSVYLLNMIRNFSAPDFKEPLVFSRPYFENVLAKIYENDKRTNNQFVLIYGDFDKLNNYNTKYGFKAGNKAISTSLKLISQYIPTSSTISRISGDEFVIVINKIDANSAINLCSNLNSLLNSNKECLNLTFGISDSLNYSNLNDMLINSEKLSSQKKLESHSKGSYKEILQQKIQNNFSNFFNNYRFSNYFEFTPEHMKTLAQYSLNSTISLLHSPNVVKQILNKKENTDIHALNDSILDYDTARQIDDCVRNNASLPKNVNADSLNDFANLLIRNPLSGLYTKSYFEKFFKEHYLGSYFITNFVDILGIKDCNTRFSHAETDAKLSKVSDSIISILNKCNVNFNNDNFSTDEKSNYIFDFGGGKYFSVINQHNKDIPYTILSLAGTLNFFSGIEPLYATSAYNVQNSKNSKNLDYEILSLQEQCDAQKKFIKQETLNSLDEYESLKIFVADSVQYYIQNDPDPFNIKNQSDFINLITQSILEESHKSVCEYNNNHTENEK